MEFAFGTGFANPGQTITPGNAKLHTPTTMALGRTAEDLGYDALWIWNRI
jgi:alkanesulfonate monooxygenase SsuD/methylene tetrahydromethanopterin reductase-like flavin-dependent oxidoreductase (luciferase family)